MNEPYLVDGENLAVALLHLLELPQEVPARAQAHKPSSKKPHQSNQSNNQRITAWPCHDSKALTRTWTWRGPRWWPRASCGRSWGAHRRASAARAPPPGTDGTARAREQGDQSDARMKIEPPPSNGRSERRLTLKATISASSSRL